MTETLQAKQICQVGTDFQTVSLVKCPCFNTWIHRGNHQKASKVSSTDFTMLQTLEPRKKTGLTFHYPYHPCMVDLPTFSWFLYVFMVNVGMDGMGYTGCLIESLISLLLKIPHNWAGCHPLYTVNIRTRAFVTAHLKAKSKLEVSFALPHWQLPASFVHFCNVMRWE